MSSGLVHQLTKEQMSILDSMESNYVPTKVTVTLYSPLPDGSVTLDALAYMSPESKKCHDGLKPTHRYLKLLQVMGHNCIRCCAAARIAAFRLAEERLL